MSDTEFLCSLLLPRLVMLELFFTLILFIGRPMVMVEIMTRSLEISPLRLDTSRLMLTVF